MLKLHGRKEAHYCEKRPNERLDYRKYTPSGQVQEWVGSLSGIWTHFMSMFQRLFLFVSSVSAAWALKNHGN